MPSILCSQIETPGDRRLCDQIVAAIDGAEQALKFDNDVETSRIQNFVANLLSSLSSQIGDNHRATRTQVSRSEQFVNNNVSSEANNTRNTVRNAQNSIQGMMANGLQSLASFLHDVRENINEQTAEGIEENREAIEQTEQNLGAQLAVSALDIIGQVNDRTEGLRSAIHGVAEDIDNTIGDIEGFIGDSLESIGASIRDALQNLFQPFIDWLMGIIQNLLNWKDDRVGEFKDWLLDLMTKLGDVIENLFDNPQDFLLFSRRVAEGSPTNNDLLRIFMAIALFIPNAFAVAGAFYTPFINQIEQQTNVLTPTALIPPDTLVQGLWKGTIDNTLVIDQLARWGYDADSMVALFETSKQVLGFGEIQQLFNRGLITRDDALDRLSRLGIDDADSDLVSNLFRILPPITDIIRFAVREAFSPEIVQKFRLDEDLPQEFLEQAALRGLNRDDALLYWRSHWELPSITAGFEMFHRNILSEDDLVTLLRTQDINPFYRDKLIEMSFRLPTRVDIRRLFYIGVWNREQVKDAYQKTGYTEEVAEALTRLTEQEYAPEDIKDENDIQLLARTSVEKAYKRGLITFEDAVDNLIDLRYSRESAELLLELAMFNATVDDVEDLKDDFDRRIRNIIIKLYTRRTIPETQAVEQLGDLGFEPIEAEQLLDTADIEFNLGVQDDILNTIQKMYIDRTIGLDEITSILAGFEYTNDEINRVLDFTGVFRELRTRKPTLSQFTNFLKQGVINLFDYRVELQGLGYADRYVEMYIDMLLRTDPDLFIEQLEE